jgi:membrane protein implicated in regulation of membrane protease activity
MVSLVVWLLLNWAIVPLWVGAGSFAVWVLKDLALYPWVRRAYEVEANTGTQSLIGAKAIAQERLDPEGYVKLNGELWKARVHPPGDAIAPQAVVKVQAARGMTLIVERLSDSNRDR